MKKSIIKMSIKELEEEINKTSNVVSLSTNEYLNELHKRKQYRFTIYNIIIVIINLLITIFLKST